MLRLNRLILLAMMAGSTPALAAPLIEAIYQRNETLDGAEAIPGFVPRDLGAGVLGDVVRSNGQRDITVLPNGNFVGVVNTNPQQIGIGAFPSTNSRTAGISYLFGSTDLGNTPRALAREATIGPEVQLEFTGSSGIDFQGNVSYTASLLDPSDPQISTRSSLWENETLVLAEGDAFGSGPLAGSFFTSAGGVYRSPAGDTSWVTGYSDTATGDTIGTALVRGTTSFDVLLQSGDTIPGLGEVRVGGLTNVMWSQQGSNYILEVEVEADSNSFEALSVNGGAVFTASGGLVSEGQSVPTADGGLVGEQWTGFQFTDVTNAGAVAFGAFTNGPDGQDEVIVVDGQVRYREGDMVDGVLLSGQPLGLAINDRGDVAFAWSETVFINDKKIAGIGTLVDSDGDGLADAAIDGTGISLGGLEISDALALGGDDLPVVYFSGEFNGSRDAYFRLAPVPAIAADYNVDSLVTAADYVVWRDSVGGAAGLLRNDVIGGVIDNDQFDAWADRFGSGAAAPLTAAATVPEPSGGMLPALALLCCNTIRSRRGS